MPNYSPIFRRTRDCRCGANLHPAIYTPNKLNRYSSRTVPSTFDVIGLAMGNKSTLTVNSVAPWRNMMRFTWPTTFLILALQLCSCVREKEASVPAPSTVRQTILDEVMAGEEVRWRVKQTEQDLPSDTWIAGTASRPGRRNTSRFTREYELANELLNKVKTDITQMSARSLLDSLKTFPYAAPGSFSGVAYYVYRDGNQEIIKELSNRSRKELEALRKYQNDTGEVFTGDSGAPCSIGNLIDKLVASP